MCPRVAATDGRTCVSTSISTYCEQVKSIHASTYAGKASGIQLSTKASNQGRVAGSSSPNTNAALKLQHTVMDPLDHHDHSTRGHYMSCLARGPEKVDACITVAWDAAN